MVPTEGSGPSPNGGGSDEADALERIHRDQTVSETDQTLSDEDQTRSDSDQGLADRDQDSSDRDQRAADLEQAASDREQASHGGGTSDQDGARADRSEAADERLQTRTERGRTAAERQTAAAARDLNAQARDRAAAERDRAAESLERMAAATPGERRAAKQLAAVRARAAEDRARAAADRAAAAADRERAAHDREVAAVELRHAYHDALTGAFRRELGDIALHHELERARRADGRLILVVVDVDRLKQVNDRDGHAAGDALLVGLVAAMRAKLRGFDPVVRYGGDEFVVALTGTDAADATERFVAIKAAFAQAHDGAGISIGVAELCPGDTLADLLARGDAALYEAKRHPH